LIRIEHASKHYHKAEAVHDLSLHVPPGRLFGFLGPNGAGKTTTIKMMTGLLAPTSGRILIHGFDVVKEPLKAKAVTGYIPDRPYLYEKLTGIEFLRFMNDLYCLEASGFERRAMDLLELFELAHAAHELIESYSHGMKQRLVMASALIHQPRVLIVDEPMVGLDPKGMKLVRALFRKLCDKGATIFMSTHTLALAQDLCDEIGIIHKGRLLAQGSLADLEAQAQTGFENPELEAIFLKLTGEPDLEESLRHVI
jgi:ABC-2 type transport system ATP-binding protein